MTGPVTVATRQRHRPLLLSGRRIDFGFGLFINQGRGAKHRWSYGGMDLCGTISQQQDDGDDWGGGCGGYVGNVGLGGWVGNME